jgi:hypothetical protein
LGPFTAATKIADRFKVDRNERKPVRWFRERAGTLAKQASAILLESLKVPYAEAGLIAEGVVTLDSAAVKFAPAELILSGVGHGVNVDSRQSPGQSKARAIARATLRE